MKYIKILIFLPLVLLLACEPPVIEETAIIDNVILPPATLAPDNNQPVVDDNPPTINNELPIRGGLWPYFGNRPPFVDNGLPPLVGNDRPPYVDHAPPADQPSVDNGSPEWVDGIVVPETKYPINKKPLRDLRMGDILYVDMFRHNNNAATFDLTPLGIRENDHGIEFVSVGYFSDNETNIANNSFVIRRMPHYAILGTYTWEILPVNDGPNNSRGSGVDVISTKDSETGPWKQTIYTGMPIDYTINDTDGDESNNVIKVSSREINRVCVQILYGEGLEILTLKGLNNGSGRIEVVGMFTSRGPNNNGAWIGDNDIYGPYIKES